MEIEVDYLLQMDHHRFLLQQYSSSNKSTMKECMNYGHYGMYTYTYAISHMNPIQSRQYERISNHYPALVRKLLMLIYMWLCVCVCALINVGIVTAWYPIGGKWWLPLCVTHCGTTIVRLVWRILRANTEVNSHAHIHTYILVFVYVWLKCNDRNRLHPRHLWNKKPKFLCL